MNANLLITNINTTPENMHKKQYARSLGKQSMEEQRQNRKTPRKPQKKRTLPAKFSPNHWFFVWFSQGFFG